MHLVSTMKYTEFRNMWLSSGPYAEISGGPYEPQDLATRRAQFLDQVLSPRYGVCVIKYADWTWVPTHHGGVPLEADAQLREIVGNIWGMHVLWSFYTDPDTHDDAVKYDMSTYERCIFCARDMCRLAQVLLLRCRASPVTEYIQCVVDLSRWWDAIMLEIGVLWMFREYYCYDNIADKLDDPAYPLALCMAIDIWLQPERNYLHRTRNTELLKSIQCIFKYISCAVFYYRQALRPENTYEDRLIEINKAVSHTRDIQRLIAPSILYQIIRVQPPIPAYAHCVVALINEFVATYTERTVPNNKAVALETIPQANICELEKRIHPIIGFLREPFVQPSGSHSTSQRHV